MIKLKLLKRLFELFLLLRVNQKALQLPVSLFFFFFLSSVFLSDPTKVFLVRLIDCCCMYLWQYPPAHLILNFLCENIKCHVL